MSKRSQTIDKVATSVSGILPLPYAGNHYLRDKAGNCELGVWSQSKGMEEKWREGGREGRREGGIFQIKNNPKKEKGYTWEAISTRCVGMSGSDYQGQWSDGKGNSLGYLSVLSLKIKFSGVNFSIKYQFNETSILYNVSWSNFPNSTNVKSRKSEKCSSNV